MWATWATTTRSCNFRSSPPSISACSPSAKPPSSATRCSEDGSVGGPHRGRRDRQRAAGACDRPGHLDWERGAALRARRDHRAHGGRENGAAAHHPHGREGDLRPDAIVARGPSVRELYVELDEAIEQGDYNGAQKIKDEIDEALSSTPSTASPLQAAVGESSAGSAEEALTQAERVRTRRCRRRCSRCSRCSRRGQRWMRRGRRRRRRAAAAQALELEALELEAQIRAKQQQRAQEQQQEHSAAAATAVATEKLKHEDEHQVEHRGI